MFVKWISLLATPQFSLMDMGEGSGRKNFPAGHLRPVWV
jgi:hypothetical protein